MSLSAIPTTQRIAQKDGTLEQTYASWFSSIQKWLSPQGQFGPTASRPTKNLWVGQDFFDQTLGYKVTIKSLNPTVWVDGSGTIR